MDPDTREFTQRMLFMEYVEEWEQLSFKNREYLSLTTMFLAAQNGYEEDEEYETCQLFKDTYQRFKSEFKDLG